MGSGASAEFGTKVHGASSDEITAALVDISGENRAKILALLEGAAPAAAPADGVEAPEGEALVEGNVGRTSSSWEDYALVGMFSEVEINEMIASVPEAVRAKFSGEDFAKFCGDTFNMIDANKNGSIDGDELLAAVKIVVPEHIRSNLNMENKDITCIIKSFDANKNGKIEPDEFCRFTKWVLALHFNEGFIKAE